jgi:HEAT repeat protein
MKRTAHVFAWLYLAGIFAVPPRGNAQNSTDIVSLNLRDLKSKDARVRASAAVNLANYTSPGSPAHDREQGRRAIPDLIEALKDKDASVRWAAAGALGNLPGDMRMAVPVLIGALHDEDEQVRERAARSLGSLGQSPEVAVRPLVIMLRDDSPARESALYALMKFGPAARTEVPTLIAMLSSDDHSLPWAAAQVLGAIGPDAQAAASALTSLLGGTDDQTRLEAADALAKIGRNQAQAVPVATELLNAEDYRDRARAAGVLGDLGVWAEPSIPALTKALDDESRDVTRVAAISLSKIAAALREAHRTDAIEPLQKAAVAMEQNQSSRVKATGFSLTGAIASLQDTRSHDVKWQLLRPIHAHPRIASGIGAYLALALFWTCLLWLWPISLLKVSEALEPIPKVKLPDWAGGIEASISHLLLVGFFRNMDRVLDAWVIHAIARSNASAPSTNAVTGPVILDGELLPALSVASLQPTFARPKARLLICGRNGDRNGSLACEIARWSMDRDPNKRLRKNLMIAVLLEKNFVYSADKDSDPFVRTVRDKLQTDKDAPSMELVARLLKRQRVLAVVLGLSEMNQATQSSIQPSSTDFAANALVVTSGTKEALGSVGTTIIQTLEENTI